MPQKFSTFKNLVQSSFSSNFKGFKASSPNRQLESDDVPSEGHPHTKESNSLKDAYNRRRRQVRQAQVNSRQRSENYTKALEEEVNRLRELRRLDEEHQAAEVENQALRDLMASHSIALPDSISHWDQSTNGAAAELSLVGSPGPRQHLHARALIHGTNHRTMSSTGNPPSEATEGNFPSSREGRTNQNPHLDTELAGFDFVLMLEQPCLSHTGHAAMQMMPDQASGHVLTLQAASLACAPSSPASPGSTWTVPTAELERLLELSGNLDLVSELTPIQAWDRIRKHPRFSELTPEGLQALAGRLLQEIRCYGFGGVIQESAFTALLMECFPFGSGQR